MLNIKNRLQFILKRHSFQILFEDSFYLYQYYYIIYIKYYFQVCSTYPPTLSELRWPLTRSLSYLKTSYSNNPKLFDHFNQLQVSLVVLSPKSTFSFSTQAIVMFQLFEVVHYFLHNFFET